MGVPQNFKGREGVNNHATEIMNYKYKIVYEKKNSSLCLLKKTYIQITLT